MWIEVFCRLNEVFLAAPRKLVPLSEQMVLGFPRRAMERLRAAINASVDKLVTTSM